MKLQVFRFLIIVNLRDWSISRGLHDAEVGPVLVDWEDVGLFKAAATWLTKWEKGQHPYWVQQKRGGLPRLVAFLKWTFYFFIASNLYLVISDLKTIKHLATGVRHARSGGVWTSNVTDDIVFGDDYQTRAWASLPKLEIMAMLAYRLYPSQYLYCLYWMSQQYRQKAAYLPEGFDMEKLRQAVTK